jgi:hypothetical protein
MLELLYHYLHSKGGTGPGQSKTQCSGGNRLKDSTVRTAAPMRPKKKIVSHPPRVHTWEVNPPFEISLSAPKWVDARTSDTDRVS